MTYQFRSMHSTRFIQELMNKGQSTLRCHPSRKPEERYLRNLNPCIPINIRIYDKIDLISSSRKIHHHYPPYYIPNGLEGIILAFKSRFKNNEVIQTRENWCNLTLSQNTISGNMQQYCECLCTLQLPTKHYYYDNPDSFYNYCIKNRVQDHNLQELWNCKQIFIETSSVRLILEG